MLNWFRSSGDARTHALLEETNQLLREACGLLRQIVRPTKPYGLRLSQIGETNMAADLLYYQVTLSPLPDPTDVVLRTLVVFADGEAVAGSEIGPRDEFPPFAVKQNTIVELRFVDVDDAGNHSPPLEYMFEAIDEIPPDQPGGLSVTPVSETPGDEYVG